MNVPHSEEDFSSRSIQVTFNITEDPISRVYAEQIGSERAKVGFQIENSWNLSLSFEHSAAQSQLESNGKIRYKENIAAGKRRYARTLVHDFESHQSNYET